MLVLLFLLIAVPCFADARIDSLIDSAPGLDKYPQASAVTIFDRNSIVIDKDGQRFSRREYLLKILDERAKDTYGDQSVSFDADDDTVIIETAKTRLPNGTWIDPEKDAFTITSAPEVQWASAYSQLKQQNVSFPGMDVGAAIYFVYRKEPKPGVLPTKKPHAGGTVLFGNYEPILERSFVIQTAPGRGIRYELQNGALPPQLTINKGDTVLTWLAKDCPQILHEPNAVGLTNLVPRMLWTSFSNWESLGTYISDYFWAKVDSSRDAVDGYFKVTSQELKGTPGMMNAALWTLWNIRTVRLPLGRVGYEPNTADRVWQNKYGDVRDKAVFLTAILRAYGFAPIPVLVTNSSAPLSELPVLEQFGHIVLAVPNGTDTTWLDPTAEYYTPGTLPYRCTYGKGCMLVGGAPLLVKVSQGINELDGTKTVIRATLNENGDLSGEAESQPIGDFAARARAEFKDQKDQERDIYAQGAAARIGAGTTVTSFSVSDPGDLVKPVSVKLGFDSPGFAVHQEDMVLVNVASNPFDFATTGFYPSLPTVRYPVQLPGRSQSSTEFVMTIPNGYKVTYLPPPVIIENPFVHIELIAKQAGQNLTWLQTVKIKADQVSLADYQTLRDAYQNLILPKNRLAILETVGSKSMKKKGK